MCDKCIEGLQARMDEYAAKNPPERLVVHIDNFSDLPLAESLTKEQVASGLHDNGENCWCRPIIVEPSDDRTAIEVFADYIARDVGETLT
jgi:hypothetical protein